MDTFSNKNSQEREKEVTIENFPLTGAQAWFFHHSVPNPHHFNIAKFIEIPSEIHDIQLIEQAARLVVAFHEGLQVHFVYNKQEYQQCIMSQRENISFTHFNFSTLSPIEQLTAIEKEATKLHTSLNLFEGPALQIALFDCGKSQPKILLIIVHHQILDGFSLSIILRDFVMILAQLAKKETVKLALPTTPLKQWSWKIAELSQSKPVKQDVLYWSHLPWSKVARLPVDYPQGRAHNTIGSTNYLKVSLSIEKTDSLIRNSIRAFKTQIHDVLLTVFVQTLAHWTSTSAVQVSVVCHGRDVFSFCPEINLTRTVGNLTHGTEHLVLELAENATPLEQIHSIQHQFHAMPHGGFSDDWLLYFCKDTDIMQQMRGLPNYEVVFNYHGQRKRKISSTLLSPLTDALQETHIPTQHSENSRSGLLVCQAIIIDQELHITWEYSKNLYSNHTIEHLSHTYMQFLNAYI